MRRSRFALAFVAVTIAAIGSIVACSSNDPKPPPANNDTDGSTNDKPITRADATADGDVDSSVDASNDDGATTPGSDHCTNGLQDDQETDIDCGGTECGKCLDGKACIRNDDCFGGALGGACENNVCKTPNCTDNTTNGGETDVDCGGSTCAKCTIGKKCNAASDCQSGLCNTGTCDCPPGMSKATTQVGSGTFCIDRAEATKGEYSKFLVATSNTVPTQSVLCTGNQFQPRHAWPAAPTPPEQNGLAFNKSLPVHYVDWCDAYAYCKWQGKQLCGKIGGGSLTSAEGNDVTKSAWYSACTQEATSAYPYGTDFRDDTCNGTGIGATGPVVNDRGGFGFDGNQDQGVYTVATSNDQGQISAYENKHCYGGPLSDCYQMSGNVAEWEDACDDPTSPTSACRVRGGSFKANNDPATLACNADRRLTRVPAGDAAGNASLEDIGIRCCLY